jgi:hypothetical protein
MELWKLETKRKGYLNQICFSFLTLHKSVLERKCTEGPKAATLDREL